MSTKNIRKIRQIEKIVARMRESIGAKNDSVLAKELGIKPNSVSSWADQKTIPYKYIDILSENTNRPFEWFLDGNEAGQSTALPGLVYTEELAKVIEAWKHLTPEVKNIVVSTVEVFCKQLGLSLETNGSQAQSSQKQRSAAK
jgi:hypothetical protein